MKMRVMYERKHKTIPISRRQSRRRCTNCQTGSFGEYVIRHTLRYNNIPYESEVPVRVDGQNYRLDFIIDGRIALEYSGLQHFENGLYFNQKITDGVAIKQQWSMGKGYTFYEIIAERKLTDIVRSLEGILGHTIDTPSSKFFAESNESMSVVLTYMESNSARKTSRDLNVPISKIRKYTQLAGFPSVSAWQAEHKKDEKINHSI